MTLYRKNLQLSQELFTVISCFEVVLRNRIDETVKPHLGNDWLRDSLEQGQAFGSKSKDFNKTRHEISKALNDLKNYSHEKLVASLGFGFWRFMFNGPHFKAVNQQIRTKGVSLMSVFPQKPKSSPQVKYNQSYVFQELSETNKLRNRIAHHEPICFAIRQAVIDTAYARQHYASIIRLFGWMGIDEKGLLYGIDHVETLCDRIDAL